LSRNQDTTDTLIARTWAITLLLVLAVAAFAALMVESVRPGGLSAVSDPGFRWLSRVFAGPCDLVPAPPPGRQRGTCGRRPGQERQARPRVAEALLLDEPEFLVLLPATPSLLAALRLGLLWLLPPLILLGTVVVLLRRNLRRERRQQAVTG
jgi:hypothetical protein